MKMVIFYSNNLHRKIKKFIIVEPELNTVLYNYEDNEWKG